LYKVKYKKHKKNNAQKGNNNGGGNGNNVKADMKMSPQSTPPTVVQHQQQQQQVKQESANNVSLSPGLLNGNILKAALTNPSEINHLRHRLDNAVSSSRDRSISIENAVSMIQTLIDCDAMEDIATLPHFSEFLEDKSEISDKLCNIGDSIVHKLVSWTKKLPFYLEIPVEIHTKLLTDKWHEILVLTTATYQAMHGRKFTQPQQAPPTSIAPDKHDPEFTQEVRVCVQHTTVKWMSNKIFF
jgi:nuclear receptor subfamily 6 group A